MLKIVLKQKLTGGEKQEADGANERLPRRSIEKTLVLSLKSSHLLLYL